MKKESLEQVVLKVIWKIVFVILPFSLCTFLSISADARPLPLGPIDMDSAKAILADKELFPVEGIWELKQKDYIGHFLIIKKKHDHRKN